MASAGKLKVAASPDEFLVGDGTTDPIRRDNGEYTLLHREIETELEGLDQWIEWYRRNPWVFDKAYIESVANAVKGRGVIDPELGLLEGNEIETSGQNYRETLIARGLNSRLRAIMAHVVDFALRHGPHIAVYAPENLTSLAARLRQRFPRFQGSEYLPNIDARSRLPANLQGIEHQNVEALTYSDATFDLYISAEVLEHVPSIDRALNEARRVLKPHGRLIASFPFNYMSGSSVEKARLENGNIVYLADPEYHGNPAHPDGGSLVYTIPGWDILNRCNAAGFSRAVLMFHSSRRHGILGAEIAGVFVLISEAGPGE